MSKSRTALRSLQARAKQHQPAQARVVTTRADTDTTDDDGTAAASTSAELWLYGTVGGYWWGFNSDDVAEALRQIGSDITDLTVRLNSYGGSAIDGIAIANLLANHPARVQVVVDGIAASAATQVALAGEELVMSPGSQFMVHEAWMYTAGNAAELRAEADWIDKQSKNYAELYAHRAGGSADEWRARMLADGGDGTWYTAAEAVEAGLADRVANIASTTTPPPMPEPLDLEDLDGAAAAAATYDLDVLLAPAARAAFTAARAHKPPAASADGLHNTRTQKEAVMAFSPEQLTQMRQDLGLAETADEATIVAALSEALAEQAEPVAPTPTVPEGMALIERDTLSELRAQASEGAAARAQQREEARERVLSDALSTGRIAPARREHFASLYDADPEGTTALLASLEPGLVPVAELGHDQPPADKTTATADLSEFAAGMGLTAEDLR